jgi:hypothetical protein
MTPEALVGLLADPARLRLFSAITLGARTPSEAADRASLAAAEAATALRTLRRSGLVDVANGGLHARTGLFAAAGRPRPVQQDHGTGDPRTEALLRSFVAGDRLTRVPAQRERRRTVLRHLAHRSFTPGERYEEGAVNDLLRLWCAGGRADYVSVRRYLVELDILRRENGGAYWLAPAD